MMEPARVTRVDGGEPLSEQTVAECRELAARYPQAQSALLPMLHLVQSEAGMITGRGIELCADVLGLSTAEVTGVATFYTMYRRRSEGGKHHLGVCTNTMCGLLGGDAVYRAIRERLGIGDDDTTDDGFFTVEHIECQAACTYAPVMTVDWEFVDRVDIDTAMQLIDDLEAGHEVRSTRGPAIRTWRDSERTVAGFDDGLAGEGGGADDVMLVGLRRARELGQQAPPGSSGPSTPLGDRSAPLGDRGAPLGDRGAPLGDRSAPLGDRDGSEEAD